MKVLLIIILLIGCIRISNGYEIVGLYNYTKCEKVNDQMKNCTEAYGFTLHVRPGENIKFQLGQIPFEVNHINTQEISYISALKTCYGGKPLPGHTHTHKNDCIKHSYKNDFCGVNCKNVYGHKSNFFETYTVCVDVDKLDRFYEADIFKVSSQIISQYSEIKIDGMSFDLSSGNNSGTINNYTLKADIYNVQSAKKTFLSDSKYYAIIRDSDYKVINEIAVSDVNVGLNQLCAITSDGKKPDYTIFSDKYKHSYHAHWHKNKFIMDYVGVDNFDNFPSRNTTNSSLTLQQIDIIKLNGYMLTDSGDHKYIVCPFLPKETQYKIGYNYEALKTFPTLKDNSITLFSYCYLAYESYIKRYLSWNITACVSSLVNISGTDSYTIVNVEFDSFEKYGTIGNKFLYCLEDFNTPKYLHVSEGLSDAGDSITTVYEEVLGSYDINIEVNKSFELTIIATRCIGDIYSERMADTTLKNNFKFCFQGCNATWVKNDADQGCQLIDGCCFVYGAYNGHFCLMDNYQDNCITVAIDNDPFDHYSQKSTSSERWYRSKYVKYTLFSTATVITVILLVCFICYLSKKCRTKRKRKLSDLI